MDEEKKEEELFQRLLEQTSQHLETRWEYFSLAATEKASGVAADIAGVVTKFVFALLVLFFFTFGMAWWCGDLVGNRAGGFAITGLVFIPIGYGLSHWVRPAVRTKIIKSILQEEPADKKSSHE